MAAPEPSDAVSRKQQRVTVKASSSWEIHPPNPHCKDSGCDCLKESRTRDGQLAVRAREIDATSVSLDELEKRAIQDNRAELACAEFGVSSFCEIFGSAGASRDGAGNEQEEHGPCHGDQLSKPFASSAIVKRVSRYLSADMAAFPVRNFLTIH